MPEKTAPLRLLLASSNPGKLAEYRALAALTHAPAAAAHRPLELDLLPGFSGFPSFPESAPSMAENAAGKALHYSRFAELPVVADDSGLCVAALGGRPGVHSARYAGPEATDAQRIAKLLRELRETGAADRCARFVCVIALAVRGRPAGSTTGSPSSRMICVVSDSADGEITDPPRGAAGFGYDPAFLFPSLGQTFAELPAEQKNIYSHRGRAFRKLAEYLAATPVL